MCHNVSICPLAHQVFIVLGSKLDIGIYYLFHFLNSHYGGRKKSFFSGRTTKKNNFFKAKKKIEKKDDHLKREEGLVVGLFTFNM